MLDFCKFYLSKEKYALLHDALSGSGSLEQLFSRVKHIKNANISKISDLHLQNSLRLARTSIEPIVDALIAIFAKI